MRLHAIAPALARKCTDDYKIPDSDFIIKKGTSIFIPCTGYHLNSDYYPNPEKFDVERFSQEEKLKRHSHVFLPFGAGPRNCIGKNRFIYYSRIGIANGITENML